METESEQSSNSTNGSSGSGGSSRPQIAQMSLYERQAVQALQALQRQPNAAQYFHQFMLQQQLSNAQLHSLAAVQQATIAASRQASSPNTSPAQQQTTTTQASINLATTSAAQLISRSQSVSSPSATTLTQSVLLGNTTSPPLNQSQAQMYLRVQNLAVRNQQASAQGPQMQGSAQKAIPPGASPVSSLSQASSQALAVAQASSGASGQSLNLSQAGGGSGNSIPGSMGPGGQTPGGLGQLPSSGMGGGGSCPRKGTGVVQPLPAAQAVTVSQGSQTEAESAAAKKAEADGTGQQSVGMNLTRTATPAPSQTLISSATYTQIQPHSLIQQQQQIHLQQKQVVIQQQIAIHHQQQFPHRQAQLLHTATHLQLAQQQQQQQQQATPLPAPPPPQGPAAQQAPPSQSQQPAQTLVVQPMLQSSPLSLPPDPAPKPPVPIQSKPPVAPVKPPQLGAAKMSATQQPPPHIPVQVVGTRQPGTAQAQALGLAQLAAAVPASRGMAGTVQPGQAHVASSPPSSQAPGALQEVPPALASGMTLAPVQGTAHVVKGAATASSPVVAQVPAAFYMQSVHLPGKPQTLPVKRKAESEEERDDISTLSSMLPAKASPVVESPKAMEEKGGLGDKAEPVTSVNAGTPSSDVVALAPAPSAPPPTLAMVSRQMGDSKPPQAIVKPQILTHIIEGFVIQEGAEPFPVGCSQLLKESEKPLQTGLVTGLNENQSGGPLGGDSPSAELDKKANLLKCEYCGKYAPAEQFRGSKRFCSMTCAKRYNVSCSHQFRLKRKKMKEFQEANYARVRRRGPRRSSSDIARAKIQGKRHRGQEDSSRGSDNSSYDEALSPTSPGPLSVRAGHGERDLGNPNTAPPTPELHGINPVFLSSNPSRWSVEEVYEFIASLQGCQEIAEEFRSQEIDGQALLLLKEEHLMSAMNIKLGPALKICAKINVLKET
ncbi:polyhomeotic-like protein 1 isoform X3 [Neophocaena asiaeorientalis asiaeorientalis]|uniref:Polyhomeotic-like protein 1 isoform X3 n=1 Tax=Neophocaena asiaeorientalis asiaeorientalis TaxID=1706337 RepID=A0A341AGH5_NEOAA|nr:polyhomeotic-like protein 1 isoform X3 [Neophocaena asiaeorientalis asiaeorientalis]